MFAQCSGNSVISSCTVCITLLNSEDVPTMRSISISQILVLPDITDVNVLSISQLLHCPRQLHTSPRFHPRFTHFLPRLSHLPRLLSRIPRNRDHGITPMIADHTQGHSHGMVFFPKSCVECILRKNLLFLLFFLHSLISKLIMDLNML